MDTIDTLTEDLLKGLVLLRKTLRNIGKGLFNFKDITGVITTLDRLVTRIEAIQHNEEEEDYSLEITLDDSPQR